MSCGKGCDVYNARSQRIEVAVEKGSNKQLVNVSKGCIMCLP